MDTDKIVSIEESAKRIGITEEALIKYIDLGLIDTVNPDSCELLQSEIDRVKRIIRVPDVEIPPGEMLAGVATATLRDGFSIW